MPHIHELYDFVNAVFIVHEDKVLFVNHPRYGKWISIGGHIELDEDPDQSLLREIAEESGLEVEIMSHKPAVGSAEEKILYTPNYMEAHDANPPHRHIALIYFAKTKSGDFKKSAEHTDMRWLGASDLDSPEYKLTPALKFYGLQAIELAKKWPTNNS